MIYVMLGISGALGALLRYSFGILIPSTYFIGFPVSTLAINIFGSFGLSWFFTWISRHHTFPNWARTTIASGFIASFTTFSTFNLELIQLVERNQFPFTIMYFLCSSIGGYLFSSWGYRLAANKDGVM